MDIRLDFGLGGRGHRVKVSLVSAKFVYLVNTFTRLIDAGTSLSGRTGKDYSIKQCVQRI